MLDALFRDEMPPHASSCNAGKRPRSSRASDETEAGRSSKKEHHQTEAAQKASILTRSCDSSGRAREISISASNSVNTTNGAVRVDDSTTEGSRMIDAGTIDGDPSVDLAGSRKPDPLATLVVFGTYAPQVCFTLSFALYFFMHWGQSHFILLGVG